MNKITQNKDFLLNSSRNVITNLEQDNIFDPLNVPEDKAFSDLNFFTQGNQSLQFNYNLKDDYTINSLDNFQCSKKSELEFECFTKNFGDNYEAKNYVDNDICETKKYFKNNIPIPILRKCDLFEEDNEHFPLTKYGDHKAIEKTIQKNEVENGNENELTNQNSFVFCKSHKRKANRFRKKIKFLVINSKKPFSESKKIYRIVNNKENFNNTYELSNMFISKELNEKIINKKYKYKCEHPGCKKAFKTLKLKLNRHDLSNCHCKKDTIIMLYMINSTKSIIKEIKRKKNSRINRLKKLYKKCIFNLPHKDYAINIAGTNLINSE